METFNRYVVGKIRVCVDGRNPANHLGCIKLCEYWDIYHISSGAVDFFHQQQGGSCFEANVDLVCGLPQPFSSGKIVTMCHHYFTKGPWSTFIAHCYNVSAGPKVLSKWLISSRFHADPVVFWGGPPGMITLDDKMSWLDVDKLMKIYLPAWCSTHSPNKKVDDTPAPR